MFREDRYTGDVTDLLSAQQFLANSPWLWAFNQLWANGISCEVGSVFVPDRAFFSQSLDRTSDSIYDVLFLMQSQGIWQARKVPKLMRFVSSPDGGMPRDEVNPQAKQGNIAERIIAALRINRSEIWRVSTSHEIIIPQIVIRGPGPIDRTSQYMIYQYGGYWGPNRIFERGVNPSYNILPLLLASAGIMEALLSGNETSASA